MAKQSEKPEKKTGKKPGEGKEKYILRIATLSQPPFTLAGNQAARSSSSTPNGNLANIPHMTNQSRYHPEAGAVNGRKKQTKKNKKKKFNLHPLKSALLCDSWFPCASHTTSSNTGIIVSFFFVPTLPRTIPTHQNERKKKKKKKEAPHDVSEVRTSFYFRGKKGVP